MQFHLGMEYLVPVSPYTRYRKSAEYVTGPAFSTTGFKGPAAMCKSVLNRTASR